jgi:hypothetical protein
LPHSEIRGSKVVRTSPRLIAAYHVLHRLSAPRHPPNALLALDRSHYRRSDDAASENLRFPSPPSDFRLERPFASNISESLAVKQKPTLVARPCGSAPQDDRTCFLFTMTDSTRRKLSLPRKLFSSRTLGPAPSRRCDTRRAKSPTSGGARRDRTDDLMLAKHALSQLSYGPLGRQAPARDRSRHPTSGA